MKGGEFLAKIALEVERALKQREKDGTAGRATGRLIANGGGWSVHDVICTSGPHDRPFEERHSGVSIAVVLSGTFRYRAAHGSALMTPGSVLLGNAGAAFECGHEHGSGDRCLSFQFTPAYFERVFGEPRFRAARVPPLRTFSPIVARACTGLTCSAAVSWEELSLRLAGRVVESLDDHGKGSHPLPAHAVARVSRVVRAIERHSHAALDLGILARETGLSPYHFIRTFERATGTTPHQFLLRTRLREAAMRLTEDAKVVDVAFDSGFGDVSNFNRAFRAEFGASPRAWRRTLIR